MLQILYRLSLMLYPLFFRLEFGEEMAETFALTVADARRRGPLAFITLLLREVLTYPANLLREHSVPIDRFLSARFSQRPVLAGALGYAAGFGCLSARELFHWNWLNSLGTDLITFFLCGWLGGALLGFSLGRRSRRWAALASGVGYLFATFSTQRILYPLFPSLYTNPATTGWAMLLNFLPPTVTGLILGVFLALGNNRLRFIAYGAFGSFAGFFISCLVAALAQSYLLPLLTPFPEFWQMLVFLLLPYLLYGAIMGAVLGLADRRPVFHLTAA